MKKQVQPLTPAALYASVSSNRQDADLSMAAQLRALRDYAKANGYSTAGEYVDEAESGRVAEPYRYLVRSHAQMSSSPPAPWWTDKSSLMVSALTSRPPVSSAPLNWTKPRTVTLRFRLAALVHDRPLGRCQAINSFSKAFAGPRSADLDGTACKEDSVILDRLQLVSQGISKAID